MLVSEFVKEYNDIKIDVAKSKFVEEHISRKYVPVAEKNAIAKVTLNGSIVSDEDGILYVDMVANKINFVYGIIRAYTDLEPNTKTDENGNDKISTIEMYDLLCESGLVNVICSLIDERELLEFTTINENVLDVWNQKNMSTQAFVLKMLDKVTRTITEVTTLLPTLLENPEIKQLIDSVNLDELKEKITTPNQE